MLIVHDQANVYGKGVSLSSFCCYCSVNLWMRVVYVQYNNIGVQRFTRKYLKGDMAGSADYTSP